MFLAAAFFVVWFLDSVLLPIFLGRGIFKKTEKEKIKDTISEAEYRKSLAEMELKAAEADVEATKKEKLIDEKVDELYDEINKSETDN